MSNSNDYRSWQRFAAAMGFPLLIAAFLLIYKATLTQPTPDRPTQFAMLAGAVVCAAAGGYCVRIRRQRVMRD